MSLLVTLDCDHPQILMEVGESVLIGSKIPATLYPLDTDNSVEPGDQMTCITCDKIRTVRTVV